MIETPPSEPKRRKPKAQVYRGEAIRTEAVALAALTSQTHAAEALGIPRPTVGYWVRHTDSAELTAYVGRKRLEIAARVVEKLEEAADELVGRFRETVAQEQTAQGVQSLSVAFGILVDKTMVLSGSSSSGGRFGSELDADQVADRILERTKVQPKGSEPQT